MKRLGTSVALPALLGAVACGPATLPDADEQASRECLSCHPSTGERWVHTSLHRRSVGCPTCHKTLTPEAGQYHCAKPACADCHGEVAHPVTSLCTACHDPHGTPNAFLILERVTLPSQQAAEVKVSKPEGATREGLVRKGVEGASAGTGLCEVCHESTMYYRRDGQGAAHETAYCSTCHFHTKAFSAPVP